MTTPVPAPDRRTYDFVINQFTLDRFAGGDAVRAGFGFNLDGHFSPSRPAAQSPSDCSHGDAFSLVDPDQNHGTCAAGVDGGGIDCQGGVDNQYPNLATTTAQFDTSVDVQSCLTHRVAAGRGLILLRVSGVDGALGPALNDPEVRVLIYPTALPLFGDCANVRLANQRYAVDVRALVAGDVDQSRLHFTGSIVDGRLRIAAAGAEVFPFALGFGVPSNLHAFQLRVSLSEAAGTLGNLGGYVEQDELTRMFGSDPTLAEWPLAPLFAGFVDLATPLGAAAPSCAEPTSGVSVGLGFGAVRAVIAATATGPMPGMCGSDSTP